MTDRGAQAAYECQKVAKHMMEFFKKKLISHPFNLGVTQNAIFGS